MIVTHTMFIAACPQGDDELVIVMLTMFTATCPQGDDPTATCTQSSCAVEQLRLFQCCATCASSVVPTSGPVSVAGAQTTIQPPTPPGGATLSIFGVTSGPGPNPGTMSIDGVQPGTTNGNDGCVL